MPDTGSYRLIGAKGRGSALVEPLLALCDAPYIFEDVTGFDEPGPARQRLLAVNALAQVPTLVLPNGEILTESAAIALWLSEAFPQAGLAPPPADQLRARFLRHLVWIVANVYPTFTYADYPARWVTTDADGFRARLDERREELWLQFERDLPAGGWCLGTRFSALDVYVAVMTRWRPGQAWFAAHCPRLDAIATATWGRPDLRSILQGNFPGSG